eukprot:TRINITY_DN3187_c0_g3_i1.p1 TRINITY_DN3187_c0_g3~~TRINITY_DN3187_c0_g3_i1.p1  ORF type:complete len:709 (-),score=152.87 TRINITY_DN3187_c0_g3_i1:207-2333(-)
MRSTWSLRASSLPEMDAAAAGGEEGGEGGEGEDEQEREEEERLFKVMIATDTHLGYKERDPVRGDDSFRAFEEILQKAKEENVDFILHGGDLFHDNNPSRKSIHRTIELLRKYCCGKKKIEFNIVSDRAVNFHGKPSANFEDQNLSISIPVFGIHGNHDDPAGEGSLCSMDVLSAAGLVNYFGKATNIADIKIHPILLKKGATKLALYGLGNLRDERLYQTFKEKKVQFIGTPGDPTSWINIFVIHQNRVVHGKKNYIPEELLDNSIDLVVWGHEHESIIGPQESAVGSFGITQPGSSVATSLCDGESGKKFVPILEVQGDRWRLRPIQLHTIRPFQMSDCVLREEYEKNPMAGTSINDEDTVSELLAAKVEEMIANVDKDWPRNSPDRPDLPLVRLRVDYAGGTTISSARFGQRFQGRVANPKDILHFHRRRRAGSGTTGRIGEYDEEMDEPNDSASVADIISGYLEHEMGANHPLSILPETRLRSALQEFVTKNDGSAITSTVKGEIEGSQKYLRKDKTEQVDNESELERKVRERKDEIVAQDASEDPAERAERRRKAEAAAETARIKSASVGQKRKREPVKKEPRKTNAKRGARAAPALVLLDEDGDELGDSMNLEESSAASSDECGDIDADVASPPPKRRGRPPAAARKTKAAPRAKKAAPAKATRSRKARTTKKSYVDLVADDDDDDVIDFDSTANAWGKKKK